MEEFDSVRHARAHSSAWREDYNGYRPHSSLGGLPPSLLSLRVAVLVPLRLLRKLSSISTAKPTLFPNPYSHNAWIKNGGIPGRVLSRRPRLKVWATRTISEIRTTKD